MKLIYVQHIATTSTTVEKVTATNGMMCITCSFYVIVQNNCIFIKYLE